MSAKKAAKKAPAKKAAAKKSPAKKAAAKKAGQVRQASEAEGTGEKVSSAIEASASRSVIVIPPASFVPVATAARRMGVAGTSAATSAPATLKGLLASRRRTLEDFVSQVMQSARGIALAQPAATSAAIARTAGASAAGTRKASAPKILASLGAVVMDRSTVDVEALAASTGARVLENIRIPLGAPMRRRRAAAAGRLPEGNAGIWHLSHINIDSARSQGLRGKGVRIGVLDTGIDASHPEFAGKKVAFAKFDMEGNKVGSTAEDTGTHGTHVSGIAAGKKVGVAPAADLSVAAVLTYLDENGNNFGYLAQISAGLDWLLGEPFDGPTVAPGVDVLNASLGGSGYDDYLYDALGNARATTGTVLAAAIGNAGPAENQHGSPGNYDIVVAAGAVDSNDGVADFSDWGTVEEHEDLPKPDLSAPGKGVWSAVPGGGYEQMDGTSMASPVVAGAIALLLEKHPTLDLNAPGLLSLLYDLVRPLRGASNKKRGGRGSLDLTGI
ncbi:S8 family serine peptidase [Luteolibacter sp. Populi]|uniref:S8 family peptidase n=1 Tax=Luteolibacter sp. Populi TaxID=3230487 RepID=UPI00346662A8